MFGYWLAWTAFTFAIEWVQLKLGYMTHFQWWTIWHSYIADWILFWMFYQYYKIFQFERLSRTSQMYLKSFNCNPCAMAISEVESGLYLKVNKSFESLTGYCSDEIIDRTSKEINIFADYNERKNAISLLKKNGFLRNYKAKILRKDKSAWVGLFDAEFIDVDGQKLLLTIMNDVQNRYNNQET